MCQACDLLEAELLLSLVQKDLVALQQQERTAPAAAIRPLFEHEERAQVRFADIEQGLDEAIAAATTLVAAAHEDLREQLLGHMFPDGDVAEPALVLAALADAQVNQPGPVKALLGDLVDKLTDMLEGLFTWSGETVAGEAVRQGVSREVVVPSVDRAKVKPLAEGAALRSWQWLLHKTQEQVGLPSSLMTEELSRDGVAKAMGRIEPAGAIDQARQAIHSVAGTGRVETAELLEPTAIWASEIMDGATCAACAKVDGKDYADMVEAREDYPLGFYRGCAGDARCRGTLVFNFGDVPIPGDVLPEPRGKVSDDLVQHVIEGNGPTSGGHTWGSVRENKTVFPETWDDEKVVDAMAQALESEPTFQGRNQGRASWTQEIDGVMVAVRGRNTRQGAVPVTAFPLYGTGVVVNIDGKRYPVPDAEARKALGLDA